MENHKKFKHPEVSPAEENSKVDQEVSSEVHYLSLKTNTTNVLSVRSGLLSEETPGNKWRKSMHMIAMCAISSSIVSLS